MLGDPDGVDEFRAGLSERTKMVILNSPANPTGGVLTPEDIAGLADMPGAASRRDNPTSGPSSSRMLTTDSPRTKVPNLDHVFGRFRL